MCCCQQKKIAKQLKALVKEIRDLKRLMFPLSKPAYSAFGITRQLIERVEGMKTFEQYEQDLADLPEATGANADIKNAVFIVQSADGTELSRQDVNFDLNTRKVLAPTPWEVEKGTDVVLALEYVDDDGNPSPITQFPFGIASDTLSPDAPNAGALGSTRAIGERTEEE